MADIAFGSVGKIVDIALKIKEAVETVKQNEKECHDIQKCVTRVTALIKRLDEVTEAMKDEVMRDALEDLAESLQGALELVTKCQRKHAFRRFIGAGDMAKALRLVQDDILRKVTIGSFATNVVQLGITLMTIAHQQGVETEKPTHVSLLMTGDARDEKDQTSKLATGSGVLSNPLSGLKVFNLFELEVATQNFSKHNHIGDGAFARVFKGLLRNGIVVAVKHYHAALMDLEGSMFVNEMNIGIKLQHKNVVKTLGSCDHWETKSIVYEGREIEASVVERFLVIAYLPNGSLDSIVLSGTQRIYWPFYFRTIQGIAQGLHYIHEQNVVHHDMKPANILFDSDMNPVIIDFGLSRVLDNDDGITTDERLQGTLGYVPPEYFEKNMVSKKYDVFAFGVILIRTVTHAFFKVKLEDNSSHHPKFKWEGVDKMKELCDPTFVEESELTEVARCLKVARLCVEFDPVDRPAMAEVLNMLNGEKEVPAPKKKRSTDSSSDGE